MAKQRKLQILKAAEKRFAKHGLNKTTVNEIARDLRIGKATIYDYFTSKEDLFFKTIEWQVVQLIEDIKAIFNNEEKILRERFIDYLGYKDEVIIKYKLIYEILLLLLNGESYETESAIIKNMINEEVEVIKLALNSVYAGRVESPDPGQAVTLVMQSWGNLFGGKIINLSGLTKPQKGKEPGWRELDFIFD